MYFEDLSNELILCIWDQLLAADVVFTFSNLNNRFTSLLYEFCGLHSEMNLRYCSLSLCRHFCRLVPNMIEWRLGLTVLTLGSRYRCCQLEMFTSEVAKFLGSNQEEQDNPVSITNIKSLEPIFPQLVSLDIFQAACVTSDCRDILLFAIADGSNMRQLKWISCDKQTHQTKVFFDWLFRRPHALHYYQLTNRMLGCGFELTYEHTLINSYIPQYSLLNLRISVVSLLTLHVLLHYLPQLQYLDVHVSKNIIFTGDTNYPSTVFNYPKDLRTLKLRNLYVIREASILIQQLLEKFVDTLEIFYLCTCHACNSEDDLYFDGDRLAILFSKLPQLRELSLAIETDFKEKVKNDIVSKTIKTFHTPFWLNGPLGRIAVCVNYNSVYNVVQTYSLPYMFSYHMSFHTIDLIDIQFNTNEDKKQIPIDLSLALKPLWHNMRHLALAFAEKEQIPLAFLRALQCSSRHHNKHLSLVSHRGILPNNAETDVQLVHVNELFLDSLGSNIVTYSLQNFLPWLRLLPNVTCLDIDLAELKYWFIDIPYLDAFLQRLDRLIVHCGCITNGKMNEEIMNPLLSFVINKHRFSQLRSLRFFGCQKISLAWKNIDQWIDFIVSHIPEHQLTCMRFDFEIEQDEINDLQKKDETIIVPESSCIVDIHRFICSNHVALWMERRQY